MKKSLVKSMLLPIAASTLLSTIPVFAEESASDVASTDEKIEIVEETPQVPAPNTEQGEPDATDDAKATDAEDVPETRLFPYATREAAVAAAEAETEVANGNKTYEIFGSDHEGWGYNLIDIPGEFDQTVKDKVEDLDINAQPNKNNQNETRRDVHLEAAKESSLVDAYVKKEQAENEARFRASQNPKNNYYVVTTKDGQHVVVEEPKLEVLRDKERKSIETKTFDSLAEAEAYGNKVKSTYADTGYDVKVNSDGTYSIKTKEEVQLPAGLPQIRTFNSVRDAENAGKAAEGDNQYYVVVKTADGRYGLKYYPKTGLRSYEKAEIEGRKFTTQADAQKYANDMQRRYLGLEYQLNLNEEDGTYSVEITKYAKETPATGDNKEQVAGEGAKTQADADKAKKSEKTDGEKANKANTKKATEAKKDDKAKLPETGEASSVLTFGAAALAALAGLGLVAPKFKKD